MNTDVEMKTDPIASKTLNMAVNLGKISLYLPCNIFWYIYIQFLGGKMKTIRHVKLWKTSNPRKQSSWSQHGAQLGPVDPRWAPCWPHEHCYQGYFPQQTGGNVVGKFLTVLIKIPNLWLSVSINQHFYVLFLYAYHTNITSLSMKLKLLVRDYSTSPGFCWHHTDPQATGLDA